MVFCGFFFNMVDACIFAASRLRDAENLVVKRVFLQPARIILTNKKKRIQKLAGAIVYGSEGSVQKSSKKKRPGRPGRIKMKHVFLHMALGKVPRR